MKERNAVGSEQIHVAGMTHVSLSVRDLDKSLAFYRGVLGLSYLVEPFEGVVFDGREAILMLSSGTALCLQQHLANAGEPFDPHRTGLDHIALQVDSEEILADWSSRLTDAGIDHSGVKAPRLRFDD